MADKEENESPQQTPEARIAKLEKGRLVNWIIMAVLAVFVLVEAGVLIIYATQGPDPRVPENTQRLELILDDIKRLEVAFESATAYNENAERLEGKLERIMTTIQLNNFSALRKLMIEQEDSYQQFLTAMQQGMYDISRMVKGSRTWYEVYKEDLDLVIGDSNRREEKLGTGLIEPLKREPVSKDN
ncbi:MAG: hypothetical protein V7752_09240 [Halopseudomonas sp.]